MQRLPTSSPNFLATAHCPRAVNSVDIRFPNSYPLASVASREPLMLEKVSLHRPPALQHRPTQAPQRS